MIKNGIKMTIDPEWARFLVNRLNDYLKVYEEISGETPRTKNSRVMKKMLEDFLKAHEQMDNMIAIFQKNQSGYQTNFEGLKK